jgi:hypothetical protein
MDYDNVKEHHSDIMCISLKISCFEDGYCVSVRIGKGSQMHTIINSSNANIRESLTSWIYYTFKTILLVSVTN